MKLKKLFELVIEHGKRMDPRGLKNITEEMKRLKTGFDGLSDSKKEEFDKDRLENPYADTRILFGDPEQEIKTIMVGIDIEIGEILLADRLKERGMPIDLVMSHHPEGKALAGFFNVMQMQADILNKQGVPINIAEGMLEDRIKEVERKVMPANHNRSVDAARLLNIAYICTHTPSDNGVATFLQDVFDRKRPSTIGEVIKLLKSIPEYKHAVKNNMAPKILVGSENRRAGKVFVDMTGGTEGPEKIFDVLSQAGVGTVVGMHFSEKHIQEAQKSKINMVVAGHMSSDNIGMNLLLDSLEKRSRLSIIPCSGFHRVRRKS